MYFQKKRWIENEFLQTEQKESLLVRSMGNA